MKMFFNFVGFNGFGQFARIYGNKVDNFKVFYTTSDRNPIMSLSWSYTAFAFYDNLRLLGFITSQPHTAINRIAPGKIMDIAACDRFCLILLESGQLFKILPGIEAAFREVRLATISEPVPIQQKRKVHNILKSSNAKSVRITHIACGSNITVAISDEMEVFSVPSRLYKFPHHFRILQLLCGFEHALLLTGNGDLYGWGDGLRGQLGQSNLRVEETPIIIEALAGIKITYIAAGGWHSAAISAMGDLYTWGFNSNGQLGLRLYKTTAQTIKEPSVYPLPQIIDITCDCPVHKKADNSEEQNESNVEPVKVFAGARHTCVLLSCGTLYAAGWNAYKQLGIDEDIEYSDIFMKVNENLEDEGMEKLNVICGPWSTIILYRKEQPLKTETVVF